MNKTINPLDWTDLFQSDFTLHNYVKDIAKFLHLAQLHDLLPIRRSENQKFGNFLSWSLGLAVLVQGI